MITKKGLMLGVGFAAAFAAGGLVVSVFFPRTAAPVQTEETVWAFPADTSVPVLTVETDVTEPEDLPQPQETAAVPADGVPSQLSKIDLPNVTGIVHRVSAKPEAASQTAPFVGEEDKPVDTMSPVFKEQAGEEESKISMIVLPVKYRVIKNTQQYRDFKTQARGSYPSVDFSKKMLVALESDSNFPDKAFEIDSAREKDGKLEVTYRVNVFGLDKKINTHSVAVVDKTAAPVTLKQVL